MALSKGFAIGRAGMPFEISVFSTEFLNLASMFCATYANGSFASLIFLSD